MFFYYLFPATIYSAFLIFYISQDEAGLKRPVTWISLAIAFILWPLILPISVWEITTKAKSKLDSDSAPEITLNNKPQSIASENTI